MRIAVYIGLFAIFGAQCFAQAAPDEIAAHVRAAQNAQRSEDFPSAIREYEIVARWMPESAEVQSNLGIALYFNNDTTRALTCFHKAIEINPNLATPHLFAGLAWYRLSNSDAAVAELKKAVEIHGSDSLARTWLGYAYVDQSHYQAAVEQFRAASNLDPNNVDIWYALGQALLQMGKIATAQLLALASDGGRAWQLAGEQFQLQGNREQALALFEGALQRRPDLTELRAKIREMGGTPSAEPDVARAATTTKEDQLYYQAHDAEQSARDALERVASLAPDSYRAHQILADSLMAQQRFADAIAEYRIVLRLKPDLRGIHEAMGNCLLSTAKTAAALNEFRRELQIQPHSSTAHVNVARALLLVGDDEDALRNLQQALALDRPPMETYKLLGKIDLHRHQYQAAIEMLTRYVRTITDDSSAYYLLLSAYRATGDAERMRRAAAAYQKTSQDTKDRNMAQKALQSFRNEQNDPDLAKIVPLTASTPR